ncbi:hypothetical protein [Cytobacillus gottheilii]|uniref:hypothetical protein n=1 Tax=Cytobacillus gottheilii TaxID=859144 RepID=UPI0009BC2E94|nr:hypothetical protein [Cytobacillus gottheilii]
MSKKITLTDIKNDNKAYSQKKRVELSDDSHVFIYPHFSPTKMAELSKELATDAIRAKEAGIDFEKINLTDWSLYSIIYKFADLGIPSEIKKKVQAFQLLVDWKHFGDLIEAFPKESIKEFENYFMRFQQGVFEVLDRDKENLSTEKVENIVLDVQDNLVN